MFNFKKIFSRVKTPIYNSKITQDLVEKYRSPEVNYWRERLFSRKTFSWNNLGFFVLRFLVWLIVFFLLLFIWFAKDLPTPGKIKATTSGQDVQIFDRNGQQIYAMNGAVKRFDLASTDIPDNIKQATVAAEDHDFYHHFGIDFKGMARAVINDLFIHKGLQGGSTITQQYVKNALLSPQRTFSRKIKEAILSLEIEAMYSKEQILTMYLNEIPYGSNAYGIEAASQTFFNKHAKDLDLAEAATLAAIPQLPSYYSPYGSHPNERMARISYVLDSMVNLGYITKDQAVAAKTEAKALKFSPPHTFISAPHFVMYVRDELVKKYGEQMVESGGLKVTTTLDLGKQKLAEDAVTQAMKKLNGINASNASLVSMDPKTGQILAMVGSADYFNDKIDGQVNVADSLRQPGSSFKPVVYATLLQGQYSPSSTLWDVPTNFNGYQPQDYDGSTRGPVSVRMALDGSLNIPAVKALYLAGITKTLQNAHNMGITSMNDPDRYGLSLVLGGAEVKLVDLTTAYGVFANQGSLAPTTDILKVEDSHGKVLDQYTDKTHKNVLDPQVAYEIASILSDNNARSYIFGSNSALYINGRNAGAKTGTTTDYRDAWTVGFTPSLVTGVWVGNNDNSAMKAGSEGAMAAAPIWHQYMVAALGNTPNEEFVRPSGIQDITVDKLSNKLPTAASPETVTDIFAEWQAPKTQDDIHSYVRMDKATGKIATGECPDAFTQKYFVTNLHSEVPSNPAWETPVIAAAATYGINLMPPTGDKACSSNGNRFSVKITTPDDEQTVGSSFNVKVTVKSKVVRVELAVDGRNIGADTASPYTFTVKDLTTGRHKITAVALNSKESASSNSININVVNGATPTPTNTPGAVTGVSIQPNSGAVTVTWTNPGDSNLQKINIYGSTSQGDLGDLLTSVSVKPSVSTSVKLSGLSSGQTYWFTLRAANSNNDENSDSAQYSTTPL